LSGLILVWAAVPFLWILANEPFNDFFVARSLAGVELAASSGFHLQLLWGADIHPSLETLLLMLNQTLSIKPEYLQYLPIGGVARLVTLFALARRFLKSSLMGALVASTAAFDYSLGVSVNTIFTHSFGFSIYFSFLLGYLVMPESGRAWNYVLLTVLFVGANFFSYVSAVWIIVFLGFMLLIPLMTWLGKVNKTSSTPPTVRWSLLVAFVVIFFGFNQVVYNVYLVNFLQRDYSLVLFRFIGSLVPSRGTELSYRPPVPAALPALNVGYTTLILFFPTLFVLCTVFRRIRLKSKGVPHPNLNLLLWSMVLTAVFDSGLYFIYGYFDIKYVSIMFPLVSAIVLRYFAFGSQLSSSQANPRGTDVLHHSGAAMRPKLVRLATLLFLALILTTNVARFGLSISANQFSRFSNTDATPGGNWLMESYRYHPHILSDMSTLGKLDMAAAGYNRQIGEVFYTLGIYNYVVQSETDQTKFNDSSDFIVVDAGNRVAGTNTEFWNILPPIAPSLPSLGRHTDFNQVYSDGNLVIFAVKPTP